METCEKKHFKKQRERKEKAYMIEKEKNIREIEKRKKGKCIEEE